MSTASLHRPGSMRAYADTLCDAIDRHLLDIEYTCVELAEDTDGSARAERWQTVALPFRLRRQRRLAPDLWHVLDGSRAYLAKVLPKDSTVVTAHDIIPWLQGQGRFDGQETVGRGSRMLWRNNARALQRASQVVCVSAATARDLHAHFEVSSDRCAVVHHPLRPSLRALTDIRSSKELPVRNEGIVLHVGNNAFYKNRRGVIELFAAMDACLARRLVMLGPPPNGDLLELVRSLALESRVAWVDDPDDTALADWYRRASLLLFPSLYEGYGWPVLEALSFGLPVVASDRGSLPEIAGAADSCLPLEDTVAIVRRCMGILRDPPGAARNVARQQQEALACDTERFARSMGAVYEAAMQTTSQAST